MNILITKGKQYSHRRVLFSTSCKNNIWVLPLTKYTQQAPDYTKTISPPYLEIDFPSDSGASLNVLYNDTWNEIKECPKLQLNHQHLFSQQQIIRDYNRTAQ